MWASEAGDLCSIVFAFLLPLRVTVAHAVSELFVASSFSLENVMKQGFSSPRDWTCDEDAVTDMIFDPYPLCDSLLPECLL